MTLYLILLLKISSIIYSLSYINKKTGKKKNIKIKLEKFIILYFPLLNHMLYQYLYKKYKLNNCLH